MNFGCETIATRHLPARESEASFPPVSAQKLQRSALSLGEVMMSHYAIIELMPDLRRFARSLAKSDDAANELVQAAYEHALRQPKSLAALERPSNWMRCIIRNIWIDEKRSSRYRLLVPLDNDKHIAADDVERTTIVRATLAQVYAQIPLLPDKLRSPIILVCLNGLSYRDAAGRLNIPMGTLMSLLHRARQELARRIGAPSSTDVVRI
jgi:RNA polymerase sigma-70 factor (ECF subfamily)